MSAWGESIKTAYCGIILIRGGQFSWIVNIFLVRGDVISKVNGLWNYIARQFFILFMFVGTLNEIHEHCSPTNTDDFKVNCEYLYYKYSLLICITI